MKKIKLFVISALAFCFTLSSCAPSDTSTVQKPDITQIRSICNLATLECYYHNVAKSKKVSDSWLKKDREFWIEYTGIAKIGIDISKVNMEVDETNITVTLPNAELLDINIQEESLTEDSYIKSADGLIKNKITATDQTATINSAQAEMAESVKNNKALLLNAQNKAKGLIENYIKKIGELSNTEYHIDWVFETYADTTTKD